MVELDDDLVTGFREAPELDHWVSCGVYVLGEEAVERLPERGDHETTTFPELASEGRLRAQRHEGVWLTVNTPKDLRVADDYLAANPGWPSDSRDHSKPQRPRPIRVRAGAVDKPWGHELIWAVAERYVGKLIFVKAGESLSLQFHKEKDEAWYVLEGRAEVELGAPGRVDPGDATWSARVRRSASRRGPSTGSPRVEDTTIVEVSTPQLDDVVRLEDRYGRAAAIDTSVLRLSHGRCEGW